MFQVELLVISWQDWAFIVDVGNRNMPRARKTNMDPEKIPSLQSTNFGIPR